MHSGDPDHVERLRGTLAEWERGNFAAGGEVLAPDVVMSAFIPDGTVVSRGYAEIGSFLREFFAQWRDYRIEVERLVSIDDATVLAEGRQYGTGRTSGLEIAEGQFIVFRFEDGRVSEMYWHPERDGALAAAGIS